MASLRWPKLASNWATVTVIPTAPRAARQDRQW
jgi:hypothetical protein